MKIINDNITIKKSTAFILTVILLLSTIAVFRSPSTSQLVNAKANDSSTQPTNLPIKSKTVNNLNSSGVVIAKNIKTPASSNGTLLRTIGIKDLATSRLPPGFINRTFPLGPLPPGNVPEVTHAMKELKIPPNPQRQSPTVFSQPPSNLTANNNLFNRTTLLQNNFGIRELGAFLLNLNHANVTSHTKNNTHSAVNIHTSDPLFVNTLGGFNGLTKCTTLPAPGGGTVTRCSWPPDVQLAVGPNHVMEMVNQVGKIFTKQGSFVSTFFLTSFFGTNTNDHLTDPKVMYDAVSGRWFASIADFTTVSVILAVSTSSDPTVTPGGWKIYNFPFSNCPDQPKLGFNDDKLAITANIFAPNPTCQVSFGSFLGLQYYIISKSDLINGVATPRQQQSNVDSTIFAVNPVQSLSSTSTLFMVTVGSQQSTTVVLSSVSGTVPNAMRTDTIFSISKTQQPPGARQPATTVLLDTGDARILDASWYQGKLWFTFNDGCTPSGDTQLRSCFRLDEIDTSANSIVLPELEQATSGFDYFYPALRIDSTGNLDVLFGYSSPNNYPSLAVTGVATGTHIMDSPVNFVVGSGPDTEDCDTTPPCSVVRYGDYFGAGLDPANPSIVWANGEYHSTAVGWLTFIGQITRSNVWSGWDYLGGNILGNPAVARNADGRLEVFVIGGDHALYHKSQISVGGNSWTDWQYLGGFIMSDPAVLANSDGRLEVFVIAANHALYHIFETAPSSSNSWSAYGYLGGIILDKTSPAVARNSQGQLQVFVVGPANATFYKFQITPGSSSWSDYVSLGGVVISNPVVATNSDGRLEVFAIGPNHALYHNFQLS
jgi:hypothetical protein